MSEITNQNSNAQNEQSQSNLVNLGEFVTPELLWEDNTLLSKKALIAKFFGKKADELDNVELLVGGGLIVKAPGKVKQYLLIPKDDEERATQVILNQKMVNTVKMLMKYDYDNDEVSIRQGNRTKRLEISDYVVPKLYNIDKLTNLTNRVYFNSMAKKADKRGFTFDILDSVDISSIYNEDEDRWVDVLTDVEFKQYFDEFNTQHKIEPQFEQVSKGDYLVESFGGFMISGKPEKVFMFKDEKGTFDRVAISALGLKSKADLSAYLASTQTCDVSEIVAYYINNSNSVTAEDNDNNA